MSDQSKHTSNFIRHLVTFFYIILSFILIVVGIIFSYSKDPNFNVFLWLLFLIPILIHWIGLFFTNWEAVIMLDNLKIFERPNSNEPSPSEEEKQERKKLYEEQKKKQEAMVQFCYFYNFTKLISVSLYCAAWIFYSGWQGNNLPIKIHSLLNLSFTYLDILSYLCLGAVFFQFLIVAFVTYIFMENTQKFIVFDITLLKKGFSLFPFWRFAHFFAIFMSIAFLFGFAFAFHDLNYRRTLPNDSPNYEKTALYVENLPSPDDAQTDKKTDEKSALPTDVKPVPTKDNKPLCFYFETGRASFSAKNETEVLKVRAKFKPEDQLLFIRDDKNYHAIDYLLSQIQLRKLQGIPRITLIGRADDKKAGDLYPSNYDLSKARAERMRSEITNALNNKNEENTEKTDWQRIDWQKIDWILVPYSNEDSKDSVSKCADKDLESLDPDSGKRIVEGYLTMVSQDTDMLQTNDLRIKQLKELGKNKYKTPNLMDYMYFSIYTISTTGYGDIKPATNYAKFLVSIENFFEIFFLVCFMNTLIALKSEKKT